MPNDSLNAFNYRVVRYTPNVLRDEWVNIGIILEQANGAHRRRARLIQEPAEIARVRRLHPDADENLLRGMAATWESQLNANDAGNAYLRKLEDTLSNVVRISPQRASLAEDFDAEMERLYESHVAPPVRRSRSGEMLASGRGWIRILERLERNIRVEEYTHPGDPMRLDYAYRINGTRGFLQSFSLNRDASQAKALAYTAESIRARLPKTEFTAVTETAPDASNQIHQFVAATLREQKIQILPLSRMEGFAEDLRQRVN
jgi:hypothetical protein